MKNKQHLYQLNEGANFFKLFFLLVANYFILTFFFLILKIFSTVCPIPLNGSYSTLSVTSANFTDTYWSDTTIKYTCDFGYELKQGSSSTAVCDSDGSWNVTLPPTCHPGMINLFKFLQKITSLLSKHYFAYC